MWVCAPWRTFSAWSTPVGLRNRVGVCAVAYVLCLGHAGGAAPEHCAARSAVLHKNGARIPSSEKGLLWGDAPMREGPCESLLVALKGRQAFEGCGQFSSQSPSIHTDYSASESTHAVRKNRSKKPSWTHEPQRRGAAVKHHRDNNGGRRPQPMIRYYAKIRARCISPFPLLRLNSAPHA